MRKLLKWHERFNTKEMIEDFLHRVKGSHYFAYFQVMETHPPFLDGTEEVKPGSPEYYERRRRAVELADQYLKPLLNLDLDLLVVTADHHIIHYFSHPEASKTFIAIKQGKQLGTKE